MVRYLLLTTEIFLYTWLLCTKRVVVTLKLDKCAREFFRYGHEHVLSFDFPKEWLASSVAVLSTSAGFLSVLAGLIAEFAESISSITAFPFFFSIVFQLAGQ